MSCYSGTNPLGKLTDQERLTAWKWIRDNAIVHGMPFEQLHSEVSKYFGMNLKPEWVNEFLAARKTPFKRLSDEAWAAQADRRSVVEHAKQMVKSQNQNNIAKAAQFLVAAPRYATVTGGIHAVVFPGTHAGALVLNPSKYGAFFRLVRNTWASVGNKAEAERLWTAMTQSPRYDLARRSGVDLSAHARETGGGSASGRTWNALVETRFRLWDKAMDRHEKPGMSVEDIDSIGKELATWANHATGSGKGLLSSSIPIGGGKSISVAPALFGPKLAQSYWNRLIGDPLQTVGTWANWKNASAGDKAVATQRLYGAMSMVGTYLGMLAANQGILAATGQKQQINWNDPTQSDWLAFKGFGMQWGVPGAMHSEIKLIGQMMMASSMSQEQLAASGMFPAGAPKYKLKPNQLESVRGQYIARQLLAYAKGKATPVIGLEEELRTGRDFMGRPLPWSSDQGDLKRPKYSWGEYLGSHTILLGGATKYVYEQLRQNGASVSDATMWIRAAMMAAITGTTGVELKEDKPKAPFRTRYGHAQVGR